ncbi:MAG: PIN domain-containing protein [Nanoarchaeota archaeon]
MDLVLDSNILFRTLISRGAIIEIIFNKNLKLFAPERLKKEFLSHRKEVLQKSKLSEQEFNELVSLLFSVVKFVPTNEYKEYVPKAKGLLKAHLKDVEFLALALKLDCLIWTYEELFFDIGFGISTKQISSKINFSES